MNFSCSTRALYDGMDDLTATYDYTPYGEHYATQNASATTHQYTGHDWDPAANLYFAPFRYYGPGMARWMKRDPLSMVDGANVYGYRDSKPTARTDLLGLASTFYNTCNRNVVACLYLGGKNCRWCLDQCQGQGKWPKECKGWNDLSEDEKKELYPEEYEPLYYGEVERDFAPELILIPLLRCGSIIGTIIKTIWEKIPTILPDIPGLPVGAIP